MGSTLVSVIIPFYNRLVFLDEAVMSVVRQSYRPIEIILVDDCSNEAFSIERYCDLGVPITYVRNPSNRGPASSRFAGLSRARGEFLVFLDSDDRLAESYVERQVMTMRRLGNPAFVYCFTKVFNGDGIVSDRHVPQVAVGRILPDIFLKGRVWCTSACLWNRKVLMQIEPFEGYVWEDYRMDVCAAVVNNNVGCTPDYLCFYRVDSNEKLSVRMERDYSKILDSLHGTLKTLSDSKFRFPRFNCVIRKLANKYLTCLIRLSHDPGIVEKCVRAGQVSVFPLGLRFWFFAVTLAPRKLRPFALRVAKRLVKRSILNECENTTTGGPGTGVLI